MKKFYLGVDSSTIESFTSIPIAESAFLLVDAYRGTIDWEEGDDENVARLELESTVNRKYGDFLDWASFTARGADGAPVAQILTALIEDVPTILFLYTAKESQGKGIAEALLRKCAYRLSCNGYSSVHLFVTDGNPAIALYSRLGFTEVAGERIN